MNGSLVLLRKCRRCRIKQCRISSNEAVLRVEGGGGGRTTHWLFPFSPRLCVRWEKKSEDQQVNTHNKENDGKIVKKEAMNFENISSSRLVVVIVFAYTLRESVKEFYIKKYFSEWRYNDIISSRHGSRHKTAAKSRRFPLGVLNDDL